MFAAIARPGGRTGGGAQTHCLHGQKLALVETVLDWRPFAYFTVRQLFKPFDCLATYTLSPAPAGGTWLRVCERGRVMGLEFLDRLIFRFLFTRVCPSAQLLAAMACCIDAAPAQTPSSAPSA